MNMVLKKYNSPFSQQDILEACNYLQDKGLVSLKHVRSDELEMERDLAYITAKGIDVMEGTIIEDGIILG